MNFKDRRIVAASAVDAPLPASAWITPLIALGTLVGLLGVLNAHAITAAVQVWWVSPTFSHCFLVIPVSAYFVWGRRHVLAALTPVAYPRALWLFVPLVLISLFGELTHINEIEQLVFISQLQVLILAIFGIQIYRQILFPCLFLYFLVPMGEYLVVPLQHFTTIFISVGLNLLGIPHYTEGNIIQLSNGDYEVAEACAGLRFLIATIAIGVLFAHLTYRKWHKIIFFLAACAIVPVIANGFRALGIVLVAHWSDNRIAAGADHIIYGWGFLVAILLVLMLIGNRYADPIPQEEIGRAMTAPRSRSFALTSLLSLAAISLVPALLYWQSHRPSHVDTAAFSAPPAPAGWQTGPVSGSWSPSYAVPDAHLAFAMHTSSFVAPDVDVFVNYYSGGNENHNLITSTNRLWTEEHWHLLSQSTAEAMLGGRNVRLGEVVIRSTEMTRMIWWTYWSGGRFTTSGLNVKLDRLRHALSGGGSALVAVSTPVVVDANEARVRLRRALGALGDIGARLEKASRS